MRPGLWVSLARAVLHPALAALIPGGEEAQGQPPVPGQRFLDEPGHVELDGLVLSDGPAGERGALVDDTGKLICFGLSCLGTRQN